VLKLFREVGARAPIGNHERRLLDAHHARKSGAKEPRLSSSHQQIVQELTDEDWALLDELPLLIDVPDHNTVLVHAGIDPKLPLSEQDPWVLTHVRSIDPDGKPSDKWGTPWGQLYFGPQHIVFGHNARKHPQLHPFATGLDTGCVYGGRLTAMVLPSGESPPTIAERGETLISVGRLPGARAQAACRRSLGAVRSRSRARSRGRAGARRTGDRARERAASGAARVAARRHAATRSGEG
jgi:hypothetical protein